MTIGQQIVAETTLLADAIRTAPHARVRKYPGWDLAQLGRHVGEIHGWVTATVRDRVVERPPRAKLTDVKDDDVPGVLHIGAVALADALDACDPDAPVWTFTSDATNAFWRRRMVNETTIHRWDAQDAIGQVTEVAKETALDGVDEAVSTYLRGSLQGWAIEFVDGELQVALDDRTCAIGGEPLGLWLLTMGRARLKGLTVMGERELADEFTAAATGLRGPAG